MTRQVLAPTAEEDALLTPAPAAMLPVRTDVRIEVTTTLGPLSKSGMVLVVLGCLGMLASLAILLFAFPDRLYGFGHTMATAHTYRAALLLSLGAGLILTLLGTTLHFYGRSVLGNGRVHAVAQGAASPEGPA